MSSRFPIAILSFNRPAYLRAVLQSLVEQQELDASSRQVFLFQDGAVNPFSGRSCCDPAVAEENVRILHEIIPSAIPLPSAVNLGIALNFDRAERHIFETLGSSAGIFLEDDLILGPHYIRMLEQMIGFAISNERIGYVASYGRHRATEAEQRAHQSTLIMMGQHWAFGLTKRQWLRQRAWFQQYLSIVANVEYRNRSHDRIIDLFHSWGLGVPGTSQDIAKAHACILSGAAKVNTFACFGKYIGEHGVHFNAERYRIMGFEDTHIFPDFVPLRPPPEEHLTKWIETARQSAMVEAVERSTQ